MLGGLLGDGAVIQHGRMGLLFARSCIASSNPELRPTQESEI